MTTSNKSLGSKVLTLSILVFLFSLGFYCYNVFFGNSFNLDQSEIVKVISGDVSAQRIIGSARSQDEVSVIAYYRDFTIHCPAYSSLASLESTKKSINTYILLPERFTDNDLDNLEHNYGFNSKFSFVAAIAAAAQNAWSQTALAASVLMDGSEEIPT